MSVGEAGAGAALDALRAKDRAVIEAMRSALVERRKDLNHDTVTGWAASTVMGHAPGDTRCWKCVAIARIDAALALAEETRK